MAKKRLVIELEFDEDQDDLDPDYTSLEFAAMRVLEDQSTVTPEDRDGLAERWGQSDWYWVGFCSSLIGLLDGDSVEAKDVKAY